MSDQQKLIDRELRAKRELIRGTVLSDPVQADFRPTEADSFTWVVDVDIGRGRILRDVPVKAVGTKGRGYALLGNPVFLQRDARGRFQVIGAADRIHAVASVQELDEDAGTGSSVGSIGLTITRQPFEWYMNKDALLTFDDGDVNTGTDAITIGSHGLSSNDGPFRLVRGTEPSFDSGTIPDGLAEGTDYYVIFVDANNIKLSESAGPGAAVDILDVGSGSHTLTTGQCRWANGIDGFPKISITDADGNEV